MLSLSKNLPDKKMKTKYFLLLFYATICLSACLQISNQKVIAIQKAVKLQMDNYPKSTLQDIYKNFFQDYFGPGHLIPDSLTADNYLQQELALCDTFIGNIYELTGAEGRFYRVSLSVLKDSIVPYKKFMDAFIRSTNNVKPISIEVWKQEWQLIEQTIKEMNITLPNYQQDSEYIKKLLQENNYVMHHSEDYGKTYQPHYRIIEKEIFEKEIFPYLKK